MQTYIYKIAHEKINYIFLHISFNNLQLLSTLKVQFNKFKLQQFAELFQRIIFIFNIVSKQFAYVQ